VLKRFWATALAVLFVVAIVAACGEGDEDVDPTDAPRNTETAADSTGSPEGATDSTADTEAATEDAADELGASTVPPTKGFDELQQWNAPPALALEQGTDYQARMTTNFGEIVVDLFEEEAPITVNNFVFLANEGFYQNVPIHRILSGFVIQSGDPTGTGTGGPGYRFNDEPISRDYAKGTLAMANAGPNTNGSQFFITLADLSGRLPKAYTIFGTVVEGIEVVDRIAQVPVTQSPSGEASSPTEPVFIENIEIITD
jgi:peptidylprolyl isomerase